MASFFFFLVRITQAFFCMWSNWLAWYVRVLGFFPSWHFCFVSNGTDTNEQE